MRKCRDRVNCNIKVGYTMAYQLQLHFYKFAYYILKNLYEK